MMQLIRTLITAMLVAALFAGLALAAETAQKGTLEQYFQKAKQDYVDKNMKAASEEMHKAAEWMKSEAAAAKGKGKEALAKSSRELEKLSGELKKGAVKSVKEIEIASARAYHALATNSHVKSAEAWSKKEFKKAGEELDMAVNQLEKGYAWAGHQEEAGTQKVIDESREWSRKVKEGAGRASAEAQKILKSAEDEIKALGQKISGK